MSNQNTLELGTAKPLDQIRKEGLDKEMLGRIEADIAEMKRVKEEQKARLPGTFLSLREDKEIRTFYFTGEYQKIQVPQKDS